MNTNNNRLEKGRRLRVKARTKSNSRLRLTVSRSNETIYAQIIDDQKGVTLVGVSSLSLEAKNKTKIEEAKEVGEIIAKRALSQKIDTVYFDRGHYKFHGRIKALAESARAAGLKF
jgi:large subunit ribosomal protein L18